MKINNLKLENIDNHNYFIQTVDKILSKIGIDYTTDEIERKCLDEGYLLYFKNKKTKRWHLGIWAVGKWNIKSQIIDEDGTRTFDSGYGLDAYPPYTICVFLIHDWTFDKFRPTYADWSFFINKGNTNAIDTVIVQLKDIFKNKLTSYYNIIDEDSYNFSHRSKNKYVAYAKGYYKNIICPLFAKYYRRSMGYICTKLFTTFAHLYRRVSMVKTKFHRDAWNAEFNIAVVFKYGKSDWHDWKAWNDYFKKWQFFKRLSNYNINVEFNYLDEEGNLPTNIWRGIYWEDEPEKKG